MDGETDKDKSVLLLGGKGQTYNSRARLQLYLLFPQLYAMTLSLPFSPGNGVDASLTTESTYPSFNQQSRWQFNGTDLNADPSIYARPQLLSSMGSFGAYVSRI
jgi:hypothetical protein